MVEFRRKQQEGCCQQSWTPKQEPRFRNQEAEGWMAVLGAGDHPVSPGKAGSGRLHKYAGPSKAYP